MSDRRKTVFQAPAPRSATVTKPKRPVTVSNPASSRTSIVTKEKVVTKPKINKNTTISSESDLPTSAQETLTPEFDDDYKQIAYGKFLRAMLEDCLVQEKIVRDETEIDTQMMYLATRFQQTIDQLDKTNRRIKNISFAAEQQSILNLKNKDTLSFYETMDNSDAGKLLGDLTTREQESLDRLKIKGIDFGHSKETGHQQLLDAVTEAIDGLQEIKDQSKLDVSKLKEYEKFQVNLEDVTKNRERLDNLKKEFEKKFPKFGEHLMKETSERIAKMMDDDDVKRDDEDDDGRSSD